ncbi:MAG: L,D-transpeptidase [Symploca sp. SIO3C6]|uniref:L,D-transpeptidase n=1 Tax=Symploca sp. SIO1C4 TaxID=2607765 RepID=A0A6B3NBL7_9CYAN|nr:L,D-transpeptidase [Symploca sp. SIO3C6]NER27041.1 L,D-transpeptidase [Symploca sp. SIO1C4]NET05991.1 L,D-transpeptidase [Symploca sp. SIO2B6]
MFCLGVGLTLAALGVLSIPSSAESNYLQTQLKVEAKKPLSQAKHTKRWIEIDLSQQRLVAWDGKTAYYVFTISTGKSSTPTPTGSYSIQSKYRSTRMRGRGYDIPNVPYAMYYYGGYALHGANWHNNFGTPVSHGCINLRVRHARLLYNWASVGTTVVVHH